MDAIKINVYKQLDGFTFSLTPSIREAIKKIFPDAHPANILFIAYDTQSDFEQYLEKIEKYIYLTLLGIDQNTDVFSKVKEIQYVDSQTGITHNYKVSA